MKFYSITIVILHLGLILDQFVSSQEINLLPLYIVDLLCIKYLMVFSGVRITPSLVIYVQM